MINTQIYLSSQKAYDCYMEKGIRSHEMYIISALNSLESASAIDDLRKYHIKMVENFQAERLIHLIVTMFIGLFTVLFILVYIFYPSLAILIVSGLFLILLIPYIFHYYSLENGVQRLYTLDKLILERLLENEILKV